MLLANASGTRIEGNFLGTDPSGTVDLGNGYDGVSITNASNVTVGGTSPQARNLLSGNQFNGVEISNSGGTTDKDIVGNLIGTSKDGISPLGNSLDGVSVFRSSSVDVGGDTPAANTIAFNGDDGVGIDGSAGEGNSVLRNSIFANAQLGIDLGTEGPTANDPGDADTGENGLQNKPTVASARTDSAATAIRARLSSKPNQTYAVRFFSNPSGDEGKVFRGQRSVTTGSDGKVSFNFSLASRVGVGQTVTATATDSGSNTSEFSAPRTVAVQ